ncbi:MAG: hypothetical protein AMXMBFR82_41050 [Candidatus Hydrogenedentota bacterium]
MKTWVKILLAVVVFAVVAVLAAVLIADSKYQFLRDAPRVSHEMLAQPDTSIRIVAEPPLAKGIIKSVLQDNAPSDWVMERALPYEVALLITPHLDTAAIDIDLFCNDRRLGPAIVEASSQLAISGAYPFITWESDRFTTTERGSLVWHGTTELEQNVIDSVRTHWTVDSQLSRPRVEGGHLLEAVIDNRDGALFALIATLHAKGQIVLPVSLMDVAKSLMTVADVRVVADLTDPETMAITMIVNCVPDAEPGEITATSFLIGGLLSQLSLSLEEAYNVTFEGTKTTEGSAIVSDYTLTPLSRLLP